MKKSSGLADGRSSLCLLLCITARGRLRTGFRDSALSCLSKKSSRGKMMIDSGSEVMVSFTRGHKGVIMPTCFLKESSQMTITLGADESTRTRCRQYRVDLRNKPGGLTSTIKFEDSWLVYACTSYGADNYSGAARQQISKLTNGGYSAPVFGRVASTTSSI